MKLTSTGLQWDLLNRKQGLMETYHYQNISLNRTTHNEKKYIWKVSLTTGTAYRKRTEKYAQLFLTTVTSYIPCDITACSPLKINQRFGARSRLHSESRTVRHAKIQQTPFAGCFMLTDLSITISSSSKDSSVDIVTGYKLDGMGSNPGGRRKIISTPQRLNGSGAHPASYPMGIGGDFHRRWSSRGVKLTIHLQLVPRSRMVEL
jgi:hypothetical protein